MDDCAICQWPEGEIIASNDAAKAFFVNSPARPGHIAVATSAHRLWLPDASAREAGAVMRLAREIAAAAHPVLEIEKFYLAAVGDVDRHFHIHLLPKKEDDPRLGRHLFSAEGWQGHEGASRDAGVESKIRQALARRQPDIDPHTSAIQKVVADLYQAISFEKGERPALETLQVIFTPGGRLTRVSDGKAESFTPEEFAAGVEQAIRGGVWTSFHERELESRIEVSGGVAQVESRYEARTSKNAPEVLGVGINYIQLARDAAGAWRVVSILWEAWR